MTAHGYEPLIQESNCGMGKCWLLVYIYMKALATIKMFI